MSKKSVVLWSILVVLSGLALYGVRGILFPFVLSFVLAYLLNPISEKLALKTKMTTLAPFLVVAGGIVLILLALMLLVPILQTQVVAFAEKVPAYASALWQKLVPIFNELEGYMDKGQLDTLRQSLSGKSTMILREVGKAMMSLFSGGMVLFDVATFVVITPVITYYLLADWNKITAQVENLFPRPYVKPINKRLKQIDMLLSAFVRGQAMVCLFLALFYGVGLTLIGVDLGFAVGFLAGIFSFVPYMGTMTGFVLSLLLALTQGASWSLFAAIVAVFLVGQFIEGYILTPKLVGDKVGLHPAWIIFALFAGGALFGFTGVLLAVPLFTILKVVGQVVIEAYQKTAFYKGESMTQQLILPFAPRLNFKAEDFFVSPCNQEAFLLVQNDTKWPIKMLCLYGEKGSGKTHLAHLFSDNIIKAKDLTLADIPLFKFRTVLEDIDEIKDETILFHAFNYAKENGLCLLMTARQQPLFKLPDLKSRIASVVSVKIHAPDDDLIRSILCKLFSDRQIAVDSDVIGYLLTHMERTYETLRLVVERVDRLSFEKKKRITIPLLKEAMSEIQSLRLL